VLTHPNLEQLVQLGLTGIAQAFAELEASGDGATLTHADWLGLLVDREITHRRDKRLAARLRYARLRHSAVVEDVDYRVPRGLDRALFQKLATCEWLRDHHHLVVIGPTGIGKSWLACALGHKACREGFSVLYKRASRLFGDLTQARGEGRLPRLLATLERVRLLIIDDWGPEPLNAEQRRDLLEIVDDRYDRGSLLITSQVPVNRWHEVIADPTLGDAILDRIVHRAHRIELKGPSLRRQLVAAESPAA
jgi:DNA replication protein DnaC